MMNISYKQYEAINKVLDRYGHPSIPLCEWSCGHILDLIRYCKRLSLKSKKKIRKRNIIKNQIPNEGEQPGIMLETNNEE